jgi:hypothetical protein
VPISGGCCCLERNRQKEKARSKWVIWCWLLSSDWAARSIVHSESKNARVADFVVASFAPDPATSDEMTLGFARDPVRPLLHCRGYKHLHPSPFQ